MNIAWWGLLGPLIVLLNATGVTVFSALRVALLLVVFSVAGLSVTHYFGLNRVPGSVIGQLSLALSLSLALVALSTQLLRAFHWSQIDWILLLAALGLPFLFSNIRGQIRTHLHGRPLLADHEVSTLWFVIFGVLTTSSFVFVTGAVLIVVTHLTLHFGYFKRYRHNVTQLLPVWIAVSGLYLVSSLLGWRSQSPWAFGLRSLDNAQWVAMAWSVDTYGWTTDPSAAGFQMSYHFLAQAQVGLLSRLAEISVVATTGITLPFISALASFAALKAVSIGYLGSRVATFVPPAVLLCCLSPLEANSPLSTEHFTYLVSIPYFCVALLVLIAEFPSESPRRSIALVAIAVVTTATKINTAVLLPGLALSMALSAALLRRTVLAKRFFLEMVMILVTVMIATWWFYLRQAPPSSHRVALGFDSLEYRFGMVGGPYLGSLVSGLLLLLFAFPIYASLLHLFDNRKATDVSPRELLTLNGLAISAIGLLVGSFFFTITPTGKPEIYLATTGFIVGLLVAFHLVAQNHNGMNSATLREGPFLAVAMSLAIVVAFSSTAWLWSERTRSWPSRSEFLAGFLLPYATMGCAVAAFLLVRHLSTPRKSDRRSVQWRSGLSILVVLWATTSVATNFAYGIRGPLISLVGVVERRVEPSDFLRELRESADLSTQYQRLLGTVSEQTRTSSIIVSNTDSIGRLMIAAEGQRRMWWTSFTALANQGLAGEALDHLTWRQETTERFFATPNAIDLQSMSRCGVTHAVVVKNQSSVTPDDFIIPGLSLLRFSDDQYLVLEFIKSASDSDIPDSRWLKWCGPSDS